MVGTDERVLRRPAAHFTERALVGLLVVAGAGTAFGALLMLVRFHFTPLYAIDQGVADRLNRLVSPHGDLVTVLEAVTRLGGRPIMLWLVAAAVVGLFIRRQPRLAVYLIVTGVGALLLDPSLKLLVGRLRPVVEVPVAHAPGNSFPSGHALGSIVTYGALLLVFLPLLRGWSRRAAVALAATVVVAVGVTRIALGVHFVSDVLGGWLLGAAWLGVTAYAFRLWRREVGRPVPPITEGLEPEAARDLVPAPDEDGIVERPRAAIAELLTGWVLIFGVLFGFGMLVSYHADGTFVATLDAVVPRWLAEQRTPSLDEVSWYWSKAGDTHAILFVSLVACPLMLALWRRWRPVLFLVLAMFGELSLFLATARAVDRPRPPVEHLDGKLPTAAFPSGHIAATMCLYVALAVLVMGHTNRWWRWLTVAAAVVMPVGVALSRMYRGMHHPSDFAGAALLTAMLIGLLWWVIRPNADRAPDELPAPAAGDDRPAEPVAAGAERERVVAARR
ncbi:undecaprenyl-diphosphatase [Micromonospora pattaloongensis]|uniref:Undecaprenyl-diphosphatase n=1 Tax=Micromonospora pattaloongensis TaxID=405436 RepID=A0A1H3JH91_9ACTN|nr:phosphatase PAP2 family protein [Micromonospora pattaloongensis]SDY39237.1 undecaprenyl-diphosphatase [Micromonospora pattaloongensis]